MTTAEILQALESLTVAERLTIAEVALSLNQVEQKHSTEEDQRRQLELAAAAAVSDYEQGGELTVFTDLDGEDFYIYTEDDLEQSVNVNPQRTNLAS